MFYRRQLPCCFAFSLSTFIFFPANYCIFPVKVFFLSSLPYYVFYLPYLHVVTGSFAILSRPSFDFYLPECTKACSFSSCHSGRFHCGHEVSHAIDMQSGIFSLWYHNIRCSIAANYPAVLPFPCRLLSFFLQTIAFSLLKFFFYLPCHIMSFTCHIMSFPCNFCLFPVKVLPFPCYFCLFPVAV